jgi:hypothetical protein
MESQFVIVQMDINCNWGEAAPVYRVYVNDELFCERTYIWRDSYLIENLQIQADPGQYCIRVETVSADSAQFQINNHRVKLGPACWIDKDTLEIYNES